VLRPFGIIEMVRTGIVSMARGAHSLSVNPPRVAATLPEPASVSDSAGAMSV
jgi:hypothetical protein